MPAKSALSVRLMPMLSRGSCSPFGWPRPLCTPAPIVSDRPVGQGGGEVHLTAGLLTAVCVTWKMKGRYTRHPGGQDLTRRPGSEALGSSTGLDEGPGYLGPV